MKYDPKAYFRDNIDDDIPAAVVIETSESMGYRIAEQRDGDWAKPYWMDAHELLSLVADGRFEYVTQISSDQYMRLCQKLGIEGQ